MKNNISNIVQVIVFTLIIIGGIFLFQDNISNKLSGTETPLTELTEKNALDPIEGEVSRDEPLSKPSVAENAVDNSGPSQQSSSSTGMGGITQNATPQKRLAIPGVTENDIKLALDAALEVQALFTQPFTEELSPEEQKKLDAYVAEILATKAELSSYGDLQIVTQKPGNTVVVSSASLKSKGFITIKSGSSNDEILGTSNLLQAGINKDIVISLNRYIDGEGLVAYLREDNGDGVYVWDTDKNAMDSNDYPVFKSFDVGSRRNAKNVYYSNYLTPGSPVFVIREQLPGDRIVFASYSPPFSFGDSNKNKNYFIAIFNDNAGFPGELIGSKLIVYPNRNSEIKLNKPVSSQMLYGLLIEDNGDSTLNFNFDRVVRGVDNLIIIVKFQVIE